MSVEPISARGMGDFARQLEENFGIGREEFQAVFVENAAYIVEATRRLESRKHNHFSFEVDYDQRAEDLLNQGKYLRKEFGLHKPAEFEVPALVGRRTIEAETILFDHEIKVAELRERLERMGHRPALLIEYLVFSHAHFEEIIAHPVYTQLHDGGLDYGFGIRQLGPDPLAHNKRHIVCELEYMDELNDWDKGVWFLAVKEKNK